MRVLLATDSFKGTISAADAVAALAAGWAKVAPGAELARLPMADGGEGTLDAFAAAVSEAKRMPVTVTGPTDEPVDAHWLLLPAGPGAPGGTAVVELASTSGIELLDAPRPLDAHTLGFGQAIAAALDAGVSRLIVGIGSSASTDGGSGLLRALGADFLDGAGERIPLGARGLESLSCIDLSGLRPAVETLVVTDVTNPLLGLAGAAAVFGPQKGLRADQVERVARALAHYAELLSGASDRPIRADAEGSGAAGGAGFGLLAWGAELVPGAAEIGRLMGFDRALAGADLVITGEGSYDGQSSRGKVPGYVTAAAREAGVPVAVVAGRVDPEAITEGIAAVLSLTDIVGSAERAMAEPRRALTRAGEMLAERLG